MFSCKEREVYLVPPYVLGECFCRTGKCAGAAFTLAGGRATLIRLYIEIDGIYT